MVRKGLLSDGRGGEEGGGRVLHLSTMVVVVRLRGRRLNIRSWGGGRRREWMGFGRGRETADQPQDNSRRGIGPVNGRCGAQFPYQHFPPNIKAGAGFEGQLKMYVLWFYICLYKIITCYLFVILYLKF